MSTIEKTGFIFAVLLVFLLLGLIIFSENGVFDYRKLIQKEKNVHVQIGIVDRENRKLELEINKIKTDSQYVQHLARHEYNLVEAEEFVFRYIQKDRGG
jgi:cell division protein FtsB